MPFFSTNHPDDRLSRWTLQLLTLPTHQAPYQQIAEQFHELAADSFVLAASYQPGQERYTVQAAAGLDETLLPVINAALGRPLIGLVLPAAQLPVSFHSAALTPLQDGLEALLANINLAAWEKQLKLKSLYSLGLIGATGPVGAVLIGCRQTGTLPLAEIEWLARMASAALQRWLETRETTARSTALRNLVENAPDLLYHYHVQPKMTFDFINPAITALSGYTPEEFYANPELFFQIIHPQDLARLRTAFYSPTPLEAPLALRWSCKNGHQIWVEHRLTILQDGEQLSVIGVGREITKPMNHKRELEAVVGLSSALRTAQSPSQMPAVVLPQIEENFQPQAAFLALFDAENQALILQAASGTWANRQGQRVAKESGAIGKVFLQAAPHHNSMLVPLRLADAWTVPAAPGTWLTLLPLLAQQQTVGVVGVLRTPALDEDELGLLRLISDITANAVNRSALHEKTERRLQRLTALQKINLAISSSLDIGRITQTLLTQLAASGFDAACLLLVQPDGKLEVHDSQGFGSDPQPRPRALRPGEGLAGKAAQERRILLIQDLTHEFFYPGEGPTIDVEGFSSYLAAPLVAKGRLQGVLEIYQRAPQSLDAEALNFIETLALQFSVILDNARLYTALQEQVENLSQHKNGE